MLKLLFAVLTSFLLLAGVAHATDVPLGQLPRSVVPEHYTLELRMDPRAKVFSGKVSIAVEVTEQTDTIWLHGRNLEIDVASVTTASGETLPLKTEVADADGGVLKLSAPTTLAIGKASIALSYRAKYDQNLQGAYQVKVGNETYIATQMEPLGARSAFPSFDEPAFKTPWDIALVVPQGQNAFANSAMIGIDKIEDGWKKLRFATTEKLPSYLIAFAVGPWDVVDWADVPPNGVRKTPLKLRGIATKGRGKEMSYALRHTAEIVAALETYFDYPYPFDKLDLLAAPDYSFGAMENAGLIVYRETLLLGVENAPTATRQGYWNTHAHELAHQWFGNLVTMPWWDDLWLNEAFATWMASKIVHQLKPEFHADRKFVQSSLSAMGGDSLASTRRIHEPVHHYTDVLSAFDGITYSKGGAALAMFESYLGAERFRAGVRGHMRQFARGTATSLDLMRSLSAQSDQPAKLQAAFASFTDQPGVPFLRTKLDCRGGMPKLTVRQHRYLPLGSKAADSQTWGIPMCVRFPEGNTTRRKCALIEGALSEFELDAKACPVWLHPNADGAGYYRFALAPADQPALDAAFGQLNEREQRVYADSLNSAFRNGSLSIEGYLAAVPKLAASPAREVAMAPLDTLKWLWDHGVKDAAERKSLQAWIARTYGPRLHAVGLDAKPADNDETRLLRQSLIGLLAFIAHDGALRETLATRGRNVLGMKGDGKLDIAAIDSDQRGAALEVAGELGSEAEFVAIEKHLRASQDQLLREQLLFALGSVPGVDLQTRARELTLEPAVRAGELFEVVTGQMEDPATRAATRAWFRANFEAVFKKAPQVWQAYLPSVDASGMCSDDDATELHQRYYGRMAKVEGGPRALAQVEEEVRLCAALRAHHARAGFGKALSP